MITKPEPSMGSSIFKANFGNGAIKNDRIEKSDREAEAKTEIERDRDKEKDRDMWTEI